MAGQVISLNAGFTITFPQPAAVNSGCSLSDLIRSAALQWLQSVQRQLGVLSIQLKVGKIQRQNPGRETGEVRLEGQLQIARKDGAPIAAGNFAVVQTLVDNLQAYLSIPANTTPRQEQETVIVSSNGTPARITPWPSDNGLATS
jgi:hypothetical protein